MELILRKLHISHILVWLVDVVSSRDLVPLVLPGPAVGGVAWVGEGRRLIPRYRDTWSHGLVFCLALIQLAATLA